MGQKLDFNIEDAGIKIDGVQAVDSSANFSGAGIAAAKITSTAPTGVGSTASGHIFFVYSS